MPEVQKCTRKTLPPIQKLASASFGFEKQTYKKWYPRGTVSLSVINEEDELDSEPGEGPHNTMSVGCCAKGSTTGVPQESFIFVVKKLPLQGMDND